MMRDGLRLSFNSVRSNSQAVSQANRFFTQKCYNLWPAIVVMVSDGTAVNRTLINCVVRNNAHVTVGCFGGVFNLQNQ